MQLEYQFIVPTDLETAWTVLTDIPRIAPCLPGVTLREEIGEQAWCGEAKVRVGPVSLTFAGEAAIVETDATAHVARVTAKGADAKGRGQARAEVAFALAEIDGATRVTVTSDLALSGAIAQYGRASGLIDAIAEQLIAEFVENLAAQLAVPGDAAKTSQDATVPPPRGEAISGLRLAWRVLLAMVARWFGAGR
jgi:carbon monoxide dehydrogenase subunit G